VKHEGLRSEVFEFFIEWISCPAILLEVLAALHVSLTKEQVTITKNPRINVQQFCPLLHQARREAQITMSNGSKIAQRICTIADGSRKRIAQAARTEERQDEIRASRHTPDSQGLGKILFMISQPEFGRRIKQTAQTHRRVHSDTKQVIDESARLRLQQIAHSIANIIEVAKHPACRIVDRDRHDLPVSAGNRAEHMLVSQVVERMCSAIQRFQWIRNLGCSRQSDEHTQAH